jgi:hypothetical protein
MNDHTIKHMELIQAVITRMAQNSFALKGWSVIIVAALFALSSSEADGRFAVLALFPALMFWGLDAYYLRQERLFRKLYDAVRGDNPPAPFTMNTSPYVGQVASWWRTAWSVTLGWFHGVIVVTILVVVVAP